MAWAAEAEHNGVPAPVWLPRVPLIGEQVKEWWTVHLAEPGAVTELMGYANKGSLAHLTQVVGILIARRLMFFFFTVLTLFFLFRDGIMLGRQFRTLCNRGLGRPGGHLVDLMVSAIRSTADGLVLVGLGEGALLAVAYMVAGVPHPALLGVLTGVLAMIPFGAPVVFGVASLLLLVHGSLVPAIGVFAFGMLVLFVADHFIRPVLIGGAAKLPFLWVLLGIFGGLGTFGVLGLFLGPALMAALVSLWREWTEPPRPRADVPLI
jgi:predicted PurR-regulated permease PerM